MSPRLCLHLLPASDGDCLLVEAVAEDGSVTSILVDGGRGDSVTQWRPVLERLLGERQVLDLLVVTHIDSDHIGGIIELLRNEPRKIEISEVWFNGHDQVKAALDEDKRETFSVKQADALTKILRSPDFSWNTSFDGGPIHSELPSTRRAIGHVKIDIVTPSRNKLAAMAGPWDAAVAEAERKEEQRKRKGLENFGGEVIDVLALAAQPDGHDTAKPNGSSIGIIVSAFGRSLLLTGDCHPDDLEEALALRQPAPGQALRVDVFKVPHHGARTNTSKTMLSKVVADTYAFSTDGSHSPHPERSAVAKTVISGASTKTLTFNYRTELTEVWDTDTLKSTYGYSTQYPAAGEPGYVLIQLFGRGSEV